MVCAHCSVILGFHRLHWNWSTWNIASSWLTKLWREWAGDCAVFLWPWSGYEVNHDFVAILTILFCVTTSIWVWREYIAISCGPMSHPRPALKTHYTYLGAWGQGACYCCRQLSNMSDITHYTYSKKQTTKVKWLSEADPTMMRCAAKAESVASACEGEQLTAMSLAGELEQVHHQVIGERTFRRRSPSCSTTVFRNGRGRRWLDGQTTMRDVQRSRLQTAAVRQRLLGADDSQQRLDR